MTEATNEPGPVEDTVTEEERTPRAPFAGVPVRDLVRDGVAAAALLVALALPWTFMDTGASRLEVVLASVVALLALALPYAARARIVTGAWAADERRVRLLGLAPLAVVALVHLVLDVVPDGSYGVGAGLGLALAGVLLGAGSTLALTWSRTLFVVAGLVAVLAVISPVLVATGEGDPSVWGILATVLAALFALGFLWLTVWRLEKGDRAAGVLLVAVGIVVALGMALFGGNVSAPWIESTRFGWVGVVLWPALAAAAASRVLRPGGQGDLVDDAEPRLWSATAAHALLLATGLGAFVALTSLLSVLDGHRDAPVILRLVFGVIIAVVAFLGRRALVRDLAAGHTPAVGATVVVSVLGLVLLVVRATELQGVQPLDFLLAVGVPAIVLAVLLVPRSLRSLREELAAAGPAPADDVAAPPLDDDTQRAAAPGVRVGRTAGHRSQVAAAAAATGAVGAGAADPGATAVVPGATPVVPGGALPPVTYGAPTTIIPPVQTTQPVGVEEEGSGLPAEAPGTPSSADGADRGPVAAGAPTVEVSPHEVAARAEEALAAQQPAAAGAAQPDPGQGPFGNVGATQVLPAIVDEPGARWTAAHAVDPATPLADLAQIVQEAPHLRPFVASNPSTYPALLDWLGALGDPEIDAALRARR